MSGKLDTLLKALMVNRMAVNTTEEIPEVIPEKKIERHRRIPKETGSVGMQGNMLGTDEDRERALSSIVNLLANFPKDKIMSFSRWRKREIPMIARSMTRQTAVDPNRPRNPDGTLKPLSQVYFELLAWLRLAEEGAMRNELVGVVFQRRRKSSRWWMGR